MDKLALTTRGYPLTIETKIFQQLHLIIPRESDCLDIMATIKMFSQPGEMDCALVHCCEKDYMVLPISRLSSSCRQEDTMSTLASVSHV